jgi:hypothetical protein
MFRVALGLGNTLMVTEEAEQSHQLINLEAGREVSPRLHACVPSRQYKRGVQTTSIGCSEVQVLQAFFGARAVSRHPHQLSPLCGFGWNAGETKADDFDEARLHPAQCCHNV